MQKDGFAAFFWIFDVALMGRLFYACSQNTAKIIVKLYSSLLLDFYGLPQFERANIKMLLLVTDQVIVSRLAM